jgi:hypothetical protein
VISGVDDLLAARGPDCVLELFEHAEIPSESRNDSQAQRLISIAAEVELLHTPAGEAYGRLAVGGHHEIWILRSRSFRRWLSMRFYQTYRKPPAAQALQDAIGILEAKAQFEAPEAALAIRVAEHTNKIYIDLCDPQWRAVEIGPEGWRIVSDPPARFRRAKGMLPLPTPGSGAPITALRRFINVGDDANWVLCVCWLVAALRPRGPYPVLVLQGEQGSAKSTMEKLLRRIVDPSVALVRTPPREERDLLIAASNSWVIAYDNLSGIAQWLSDSLCRLATGGGFSTRELYTDAEEVFFDAMRPVMLNGVDQLAERADLADRALILNLPRIDNEDRKDEAQLYKEFDQELPEILGALFTVISSALARVSEVHLVSKPRMADFALWATAAEQALGLETGGFMQAYLGNRTEAVREALDADAVAAAILKFMDERRDSGEDTWQGSCGDLQQLLEALIDDRIRKSRSWPDTPRGLSGRLRRLATFLREAGVQITFRPKGAKGMRAVVIERTPVR